MVQNSIIKITQIKLKKMVHNSIISRLMPNFISPNACHGSGTKDEGFIEADSIPLPSISSNNLACISRTICSNFPSICTSKKPAFYPV